MLGAGFIGWGGGIDFLKAYVAPLQRMNDCEIYVFIPQDSWLRRIAREVRYHLRTKVLHRPIGRYSPPYTTRELVDVFHSDRVHVVVYNTYWNVLSDLKRALKEHDIDIVFPTILDLGRGFPIRGFHIFRICSISIIRSFSRMKRSRIEIFLFSDCFIRHTVSLWKPKM